MTRIWGFLSTLALIVLVFVGGVLLTQFGFLDGILGSSEPTINSVTVINQIQLVAELTTTRYETSGTITIERELPPIIRALYGDRLVLFGAGAVTAGIDLGELDASRVTVTEEAINVRLPHPQLLDCILNENETRVIAREVSLFTSEDRNFESIARRTLTVSFRNSALENGVYEMAKEQAVVVIETLLTATQPDLPVNVSFDDPPQVAVIPPSCGGTPAES